MRLIRHEVNFVYMNANHLLKLTLALYRVTDCFPEKEPLRYLIREAAARIYAAGLSGCAQSISQQDVELLNGYFALARAQNWVAEENFSVLEKEYAALTAQTRKENKIARGRTSYTSSSDTAKLDKNHKKRNTAYLPHERKQKLIDTIKQEEKITLKNLLEKFPDINRRTLIRDLERLQKEDIIKKQGNGRGTVYFPNGGVEKLGQMVTDEIVGTKE